MTDLRPNLLWRVVNVEPGGKLGFGKLITNKRYSTKYLVGRICEISLVFSEII